MQRQIALTGGIGDILCLEATFTDEYRKSITRMYWATRTRMSLAPLFTRLPSFPYLKDHVSLWDDYSNGFCFKDIEHAYATSLHQHLVNGPIEDWSISKRFDQPQPFTYSSFVKYKLAGINQFKLPDNYIVICPYSPTSSERVKEWRKFSDEDWSWLLSHLSKRKIYGVVLNTGDDPVPEDNWLINLSNKTKLGEAIEIVKKASGYIGIDTSFSVLAAQIMPSENIIVSSMNVILFAYKHVYYAPKTEFDFIIPFLGATEKEVKDWRDEYGECKPPLIIKENA